MISRVRAMPGGIRLFLIYGLLILFGIAVVLPSVVERAVGAVPVTFDGLVLMILLAYTIFSLTLVLQRKQAARSLALGLATLTVPALLLLLLSQFLLAASVLAVFTIFLFRGLLRPEVRTYLDEP
jgi:hypothetical protein